MSAKMFAPQCNNIYVAAAADVSVRVQIFTADNVSRYDQTSTYTPVDGRVELGDLADLVNKCILLQTEMQQLTGAVQRFPYATLIISIEAEELSSSSMVYYCTAGNASDPSQFLLFPTQNRRRTVYPDQVNCQVWIPRLGSTVPTVTLNATYVANGQQQTASTNIGDTAGYTNRYLLVDCSPAAVATRLALPAGAVLCEYELLMTVSGTVYDAVQFKVDRRHWPQLTEMVFMNVFGLPEAVMLRGREEETHELSAEFGYSGWKMVRMDDDVTRDLTVNTGWLTKAERRQYGELYRSPLTGRQEQLGLRRIVVREIEVAYLTPTNEPASFDVTYRYADRRQEWMADLDANTAGHNIFDHTFTIAFD